MTCPHWAVVTVKGGLVQGIDTSQNFPGSIYIIDLDTETKTANVGIPEFVEHAWSHQEMLQEIAATYGKEI